MDQPRASVAIGTDPIRTIGRDESQVTFDRGDDFRLIRALNRWAYDPKHIPGWPHFDTPGIRTGAADHDAGHARRLREWTAGPVTRRPAGSRD